MFRYAAPLFLGAFLLFQVQPIIARVILPWFGGTPSVWTTCMLFFQVLLVGGYAYSHLLVVRLRPGRQAIVHGAVVAASLVVLGVMTAIWPAPIVPPATWKPVGSSMPVLHIIRLLGAAVALPYLVLATTSPLMQAWFSRTNPGRSPYRLYSLSNVGSLLGLLSYPFLIEPALALKAQATIWAIGYGLFALGCLACAAQIWARRGSLPEVEEEAAVAEGVSVPLESEAVEGAPSAFAPPPTADAAAPGTAPVARELPPGLDTRAAWLGLPALAVVLLLAVTNHLCQDVAVTPFLWVLPLSLYLLSFIICFDHERWYMRVVFVPLLLVLVPLALALMPKGREIVLRWQVLAYTGTLFVACMVCHGELAALKPAPRYLTSFFLSVAIGGAIGGLLVGIVAPVVFSTYAELPIGLVFAFFVGVVALGYLSGRKEPEAPAAAGNVAERGAGLVEPQAAAAAGASGEVGGPQAAGADPAGTVPGVGGTWAWVKAAGRLLRQWAPWLRFALVPLAVYLALLPVLQNARTGSLTVAVSRNFYGVLRVEDRAVGTPNAARFLTHGGTIHGFQMLAPDEHLIPTSYYDPGSGIGLAFANHPRRKAANPQDRTLRIGVCGLGAGCSVSYARKGDYVRFYEINPQVVRLSGRGGLFTFLTETPAKWDIVLGDARLSLEEELKHGSDQFDLVLLDAFSSDAVPAHLLTRQAFAMYLQHLRRPNGILAVDISNAVLDLRPVVWNVAKAFGLDAVLVRQRGDDRRTYYSEWMILSTDRNYIRDLAMPDDTFKDDKGRDVPAWSYEDDSGRQVPLWTDDYYNLFKLLK